MAATRQLAALAALTLTFTASAHAATGIETRLTNATGVTVLCQPDTGIAGVTGAYGFRLLNDATVPTIWLWKTHCLILRDSAKGRLAPQAAARSWLLLAHEHWHALEHRYGFKLPHDRVDDAAAWTLPALMIRARSPGAKIPARYIETVMRETNGMNRWLWPGGVLP